MAYFDIFIAPIAAERRDAYDDFLKKTHDKILGYGATEVVDLWADDVPDGKVTSLPMSVNLEEGEVVTAGYVIWPSKEVRDAGWARMMQEDSDMEMPFDGKRMIFGGFSEMLVSRR